MKTKEELIAAAYGDKWILVKHTVDMFDGSMDVDDWVILKPGVPFERVGFSKRVPISIWKIQENNGWSLRSDGLPKETIYCEICINGEPCFTIFRFNKKTGCFYQGEYPLISTRITHWKEVKMSERPMFK